MDRFIRYLWITGIVYGLTAAPSMGKDWVAVTGAPDPVDESYPVSAFGQPPSDPVLHGADRPASVRYGNRAPAGLVMEENLPEKESQGPAIETAIKAIEASEAVADAPPVSLVPNKTKGIQEVALIAGELGFFPRTFFVTRDIPVRLFVTGSAKKPLCFMMDSFQVRRQVASQKIEEITFTPNIPGQYRFYCPMNGMEGTMVVREISSSRTASVSE